MNTQYKSLTLKAFGFIAASCLAQVLVLDAAVGAVRAADAAPVSLASGDGPHARLTSAATSRRCDALDSFGNPVRPCRG